MTYADDRSAGPCEPWKNHVAFIIDSYFGGPNNNKTQWRNLSKNSRRTRVAARESTRDAARPVRPQMTRSDRRRDLSAACCTMIGEKHQPKQQSRQVKYLAGWGRGSGQRGRGAMFRPTDCTSLRDGRAARGWVKYAVQQSEELLHRLKVKRQNHHCNVGWRTRIVSYDGRTDGHYEIFVGRRRRRLRDRNNSYRGLSLRRDDYQFGY